jgi:hypothetical protein
VEADSGKRACELLIPETRGATEAVQGFIEPSIPAVRLAYVDNLIMIKFAIKESGDYVCLVAL